MYYTSLYNRFNGVNDVSIHSLFSKFNLKYKIIKSILIFSIIVFQYKNLFHDRVGEMILMIYWRGAEKKNVILWPRGSVLDYWLLKFLTFFIIVNVVSNAKQNIIKELQVFKSGKEIRWILIMLTNSWLKQKIKNRNI